MLWGNKNGPDMGKMGRKLAGPGKVWAKQSTFFLLRNWLFFLCVFFHFRFFGAQFEPGSSLGPCVGFQPCHPCVSFTHKPPRTRGVCRRPSPPPPTPPRPCPHDGPAMRQSAAVRWGSLAFGLLTALLYAVAMGPGAGPSLPPRPRDGPEAPGRAVAASPLTPAGEPPAASSAKKLHMPSEHIRR